MNKLLQSLTVSILCIGMICKTKTVGIFVKFPNIRIFIKVKQFSTTIYTDLFLKELEKKTSLTKEELKNNFKFFDRSNYQELNVKTMPMLYTDNSKPNFNQGANIVVKEIETNEV